MGAFGSLGIGKLRDQEAGYTIFGAMGSGEEDVLWLRYARLGCLSPELIGLKFPGWIDAFAFSEGACPKPADGGIGNR